MSGERSSAVALALRLFGPGPITITGTTRSGKQGSMTIDSGGAFAFEGDPEDMIAATLEAGREDTNG